MILAAGLGTRLRPLTDLRPKPALPRSALILNGGGGVDRIGQDE